MSFANFNEFLAMGGYGLYVWGSFGMCAAAVAAELLLLRARRHAITGEPGHEVGNKAGEHAA